MIKEKVHNTLTPIIITTKCVACKHEKSSQSFWDFVCGGITSA